MGGYNNKFHYKEYNKHTWEIHAINTYLLFFVKHFNVYKAYEFGVIKNDKNTGPLEGEIFCVVVLTVYHLLL